MDLGLQDKRVLVTGATRGIGREVARVFAEEGARVAITYHSSETAAKELAGELGGPERACALHLDLADRDSIAAAVRDVEDRWGGVDVVVANAQTWVWVNDMPAYEDLPMDHWLGLYRENVEGHLWTVRQAVGGMRERGWGRIVLLSSVTATHGNPGSELYSAAKASLHGFVRGLMWTGDGVLANVVAPGGTQETDNMDAVDPVLLAKAVRETPSGRLSTAHEIAQTVVFLGSAANGNINGQVLHTAGGR